ncbi:MAG: hypothetical protein IBX72_05900 [Nitrospirae bacterium]|nr:hypothetical protein [Nitrospirota bacterium]
MMTSNDIKKMVENSDVIRLTEILESDDPVVVREALKEIRGFPIPTPLPLFINSLISPLRKLLKYPDETIRWHVIDIFSDVEDAQGIEVLIGILGTESELRLYRKASECLIANIKRLTDIRAITALKGSLLKSTGERAEIILDVVSRLDNPEAIKDIFAEVVRHWCPIIHKYCTDDIRPTNEYFVAHKFTMEKIDDLRTAIDRAIGTVFPVIKPYYADQELRGDIKCKICHKIRSSKFGIYDISEVCNECNKPEPNVTWELGLAYGFGKPAILILEKNSKVISDLAGLDRIEYKSMLDLEIQLKAKIQGLRGIFF